MSGIGMIYDPNDPVSLHRAWEDHCGFGDKHGNGWVFLNDDRVVLDMIATDCDNEWVFSVKPNADRAPVDVLIEHAQSLDATNIINIQHRKTTQSTEPDDDLTNFAHVVTTNLDRNGISMRGFIICSTDGVAGVLYAQKIDAADLMAGSVVEGLRMRKLISERTDITEHERDVIIAAIDNTLEVLVGVSEVDENLMREATEIAKRKAMRSMGIEQPEPQPHRDPFALPSINISDIKYMN